MDPDYLSILMCPKTRGSLRLATESEVAAINARLAGGDIPQAASQDPLDAGLVCDEGGLFYPIQDGIPVLLAAEAIVFKPAAGNPSSSESSS